MVTGSKVCALTVFVLIENTIARAAQMTKNGSEPGWMENGNSRFIVTSQKATVVIENSLDNPTSSCYTHDV